MIDPFHLEAYGKTTVNYNRDIEIFPVLNAMFELIAGESHISHQQIWALIWRVTVLLMMRHAVMLLIWRLSEDITNVYATRSELV